MSRTDTRRTTVIVLAIWVLIAGFAAAAFGQEHVATAGSRTMCACQMIESDRNQAGAPPAGAASTKVAAGANPGTLPSLDSIGAHTGVAAFMQRGVPAELQIAALRRAWLMDPAIRDFKGLAENDWDFEIGNAILGFDDLDPDADVQWMLAGLFSQPPRQADRKPVLARAVYDPVALFFAKWMQRPVQGVTP